jgi:flagellar motor switch protein FliN/FliY
MSDSSNELTAGLFDSFTQAAGYVLSQITGCELQAHSATEESPTDEATSLRIEIGGSLKGLCRISLSPNMSARFASLLTGEPMQVAAISTETREAAAELLQQICGNAADRLRSRFGELEFKTSPSESSEQHEGVRKLVRVPHGDAALEFEIHLVCLAMTEQAAEPTASRPTPPTTSPQTPYAPKSAMPTSATASHNMDLLLDIELGASLRFGTRQMPLKEIIELCSGSVVELDRRVQEPVELMIDGRLIAEGEVVIVNGNYGLRVLSVATPGERIACLP